MATLRHIETLDLGTVVPAPAEAMGAMPGLVEIDPTSLYIEEEYQRDLGRRSFDLIRRIVEEWDWNKFKAPNCALNEDQRLVVTDGQHTAIAAACHPLITRIPVLISTNTSLEGRAAAFIGVNKNRLAITSLQMYRAAVAAGDEVAVAVEAACRAAKVTIVATARPRGEWRPGETIAVVAISNVVKDKGRAGGGRVLKILVAGRQMPITAMLVKAVAALLYSPEWMWRDDDALANLLARHTPEHWESFARSNASGMPTHRALAVEFYRRLSR